MHSYIAALTELFDVSTVKLSSSMTARCAVTSASGLPLRVGAAAQAALNLQCKAIEKSRSTARLKNKLGRTFGQLRHNVQSVLQLLRLNFKKNLFFQCVSGNNNIFLFGLMAISV